MLIYFFLQKLWRIVIDHIFGAGKPGALFKRPANVYTFHDTVLASTEFRAKQATGPGAHSSSNNRDDYENIPRVDKLAIRIFREFQEHKLHEEARKLEEAALKKKRKEASDFLAPPPASLFESRPPLEERQKNKEPLLVSDGKHNNPKDIIIDVDDDEGKENVCPPSIKKKHRTTVAGTDLFNMFTSAMNTVDPTSRVIATVMEQRNQMLQLAEQRRHDAEEPARHAEERAQHLQLLEMLHSGKIDHATYDALKP